MLDFESEKLYIVQKWTNIEEVFYKKRLHVDDSTYSRFSICGAARPSSKNNTQ